jgi:hypothetical protein
VRKRGRGDMSKGEREEQGWAQQNRSGDVAPNSVSGFRSENKRTEQHGRREERGERRRDGEMERVERREERRNVKGKEIPALTSSASLFPSSANTSGVRASHQLREHPKLPLCH